ncbi:hypothetical protein Tco_1005585 [Tanacetum coccineum]|uniref:Uncharacterized protein n=1 Tax=Tanacetum coccineum TaxID=301880 RepID=A0ABQ5FH18_9ASTR
MINQEQPTTVRIPSIPAATILKSVFTRLRRDKGLDPTRHEYRVKEKERAATCVRDSGAEDGSTSRTSDVHQESSRYTEDYSERERHEGTLKFKSQEGKTFSVEDMISPTLGIAETDPVLARIPSLRFPEKHNAKSCENKQRIEASTKIT